MKGIRPVLAVTVLLATGTGPSASAPAARCFGRQPTIVGTPENDVIKGTPRADVIAAGNGHDRVFGGRGNDWICGGDDNDELLGGRGADHIKLGHHGWEEESWGGPGGDMLIGGDREPNCDGWWILHGGHGDDRLLAARGSECLDMFGGWGDDLLDSGPGGGAMTGGPGDDRLIGSGSFEGGAGDDVMRGDANSLVVFDDPGGVRVDLARGRAVGPGEGRDVVRGITLVHTTEGDDVVYGGRRADYLLGHGGDDRIVGRGGNDLLEGGEGDDQLFGGAGRDELTAGSGRDLIFGGRDNDVLQVGFAPEGPPEPAGDSFDGDGGRDRLELVVGPSAEPQSQVTIDLVSGGMVGEEPVGVAQIEDVFVFAHGRVELRGDDNANYLLADAEELVALGRGGDDTLDPSAESGFLNGGDGLDTAILSGPGSVVVDLHEGTYSRRSEAGTLTAIERVWGSFDGDTMRGDDGPNVLIGGMGGDFIEGRSGDDVLEGQTGDDTLDGGDGVDTLDGGDGVDQCMSGESLRSCEAEH